MLPEINPGLYIKNKSPQHISVASLRGGGDICINYIVCGPGQGLKEVPFHWSCSKELSVSRYQFMG